MKFLQILNGVIRQSSTQATPTPSANSIPIADSNGKLDDWVSASASSSNYNIDGGNSLSNYTLDQNLDCGLSA